MNPRLFCLFCILTHCFGDSLVYSGLEFDDSRADSPADSTLDGPELSPVENRQDSPEPGGLKPSGNYSIFHCENLERSAGFPKLLIQVRQAIQLVLHDLQYGLASRHGYSAFFKSNAHLLFVQEVFQNITAGRSLQGRSPMVQCLNTFEQTPTTQNAYSMICEPREGHELLRARGSRSGLLVLCPNFWTHPAFPNGTDSCPLISGRRGFAKFVEDGSALFDTQFGILIRELVRMYNPLNQEAEECVISGVQECLELDREKSIRNAGNWALYAACKFHAPSVFR
ncbi:MAG: hypothetical protein Q9221_004994 [Calogaya cf. arnoldii]